MTYGTSTFLDMRNCLRSEWVDVNCRLAKLEFLLQPLWFRPFFGSAYVRRRLGYGVWTRQWEYPWAVLSANLEPGLRVLDVGSGGSAFPLFLVTQGGQVHSAEPSLVDGESWVDWRKRVARSLGISAAWGLPSHHNRPSIPVNYVPDSIQNLRYADGYFDRVFCLSVMEHIPVSAWPECMAQMSRVLRVGGRLVLTLDMGTRDANERQYRKLLVEPSLRLIGDAEYAVPISLDDKNDRHPGHTYETLGLIWEKV